MTNTDQVVTDLCRLRKNLEAVCSRVSDSSLKATLVTEIELLQRITTMVRMLQG